MQENSSARSREHDSHHDLLNHSAGAQSCSLLTINAGSSSIRFAVYDQGKLLRRVQHGKLDRSGMSDATFVVKSAAGTVLEDRVTDAIDSQSAVAILMKWFRNHEIFQSVKAVGHRIVQGMFHREPELVTAQLLNDLRRMTPSDPDHLPLEIELIEAVSQNHPELLQFACFDTAFHRTLPRVASLIPIPRRYEAAGVRRYGFHGLSYEYLMEELTRLGDPTAKKGRIILAHLGSGSSLAAVQDGRSIDTSMGFTPAAGLVMGSRSGDLDPGLVSYLARTEQMSVAQYQNMVNQESGLLGVSETSSDVRELLKRESQDVRAAEAIELFCYQAKKWIGAYAAVLGGLDTLVFTGGIGENSPTIRARICEGLGFLGINLDKNKNECGDGVISGSLGQTSVRVIHADEERMIASTVWHKLDLDENRSIKR